MGAAPLSEEGQYELNPQPTGAAEKPEARPQLTKAEQARQMGLEAENKIRGRAISKMVENFLILKKEDKIKKNIVVILRVI